MTTSSDIARRGIMLVVSSPSGAGKTTLTRNLLEQEENVSLSISVTTRQRRPSEIDGVHYHFLPSKRRFEAMDLPAGTTRTVTVFAFALAVSYAVWAAVDWIAGRF